MSKEEGTYAGTVPLHKSHKKGVMLAQPRHTTLQLRAWNSTVPCGVCVIPKFNFPLFLWFLSSKSGLTSDPSVPLYLISQHTIYF